MQHISTRGAVLLAMLASNALIFLWDKWCSLLLPSLKLSVSIPLEKLGLTRQFNKVTVGSSLLMEKSNVQMTGMFSFSFSCNNFNLLKNAVIYFLVGTVTKTFKSLLHCTSGAESFKCYRKEFLLAAEEEFFLSVIRANVTN